MHYALGAMRYHFMIPSFNRQRWILLFGDVVLILLATQLSPWLRIGRPFNVFDVHTGASIFTLLLYVIMLYIFDMYNIGRAFRSADTALRIAVAVCVAGIFSSFFLILTDSVGQNIGSVVNRRPIKRPPF